jgi:hypothetical protein
MSEPEQLYCENCDSVMAPDWSLPYCPMCGGKVGSKKFDKPEKAESDVSADRADTDEGDENGEQNEERLRSEAFDELRQASPARIFIADLLTLGLRSTFWLSRRMVSLEGMARHGERHGRKALYACFAIYIAIIALIALACRELYTAGWNFSLLEKLVFSRIATGFPGAASHPHAEVEFPRVAVGLLGVAAGLLVILFLMNRHILFWAREVIMDAIQRENADTIHTKAESFAPSPFLLWFIGVPYLQSHLNEIVRARNLANFKSSKRRPS